MEVLPVYRVIGILLWKTKNLGSKPGAIQPGYTAMACSWQFEILDLRRRGIGADQLCSYCTADLRLCFRIMEAVAFLV